MIIAENNVKYVRITTFDHTFYEIIQNFLQIFIPQAGRLSRTGGGGGGGGDGNCLDWYLHNLKTVSLRFQS